MPGGALTRLPVLLLVLAGCSAPTVTGSVQDMFGQPLPGAEVALRGSTVRGLTDERGEFSLEVPEGQLTFDVTAKDYLSSVLSAEIHEAIEVSAGTATLTPVPPSPGLWLTSTGQLVQINVDAPSGMWRVPMRLNVYTCGGEPASIGARFSIIESGDRRWGLYRTTTLPGADVGNVAWATQLDYRGRGTRVLDGSVSLTKADLASDLSMHQALLEPGLYAIMPEEGDFPSFPELMSGFGKAVYETPPCKLLLVTTEAGPSAAVPQGTPLPGVVGQRYSGLQLPPGYEWVSSQGLDGPFGFSTARNGSRMALWLERAVSEGSNESRTVEIVAAVDLPDLSPGDDVITGGCSTDGKADSFVAALVKTPSGELGVYQTIRRAWRADLATQTITEIPTTGVECVENLP